MSLSTILRGRGKRREYWLGFVVLLALLVVARLLPHPVVRLLVNLSGLVFWMVLAVRRLRDIGWPAWLSLAPIALMALAVLLAVLPLVTDAWVTLTVSVLLMISGWVWAVFVIAIGLWKPKRRPAGEDKAEVFA
ncbi:hypothetical protein DDF62_02760 [Caulobacter radicis]|uniref:hypothetical protein n=1 Tax=Caulobacter radicis TaxID=2172650 RepID=UPI000D56D0F2|nr:hypothetical protein [Caulobacter radicis]PVM92092.1 hypothetical protein DDF62_02760 [Caulobacter radicis]